MSAIAPQPSLRQQIAQATCQFLYKRVEIEVLSEDNKKVIRRFRFTPPNDAKTGRKTRFTEKGVEQVLENFIDSFERDNPRHRYRLVVLIDKYRLVWAPEPEPDTRNTKDLQG